MRQMRSDPGVPTLLDALLPVWTDRLLHGRPVGASVERTADAIRTTPLADARVAALLVAARTHGTSRGSDRPFIETGDFEPGLVSLGSTETEACIGFVGRPWPGGAPAAPVADSATFRDMEIPDLVRVAVSIRCAAATYGTLLLTETRVEVGPLAARPFGLYWRLVRPAAGLVRTSLLRAIARRAETGTLS